MNFIITLGCRILVDKVNDGREHVFLDSEQNNITLKALRDPDGTEHL